MKTTDFTQRALFRLAAGTAALVGLEQGARPARAQALRGPGPLTNRDFEPLGGQPPQGAIPARWRISTTR